MTPFSKPVRRVAIGGLAGHYGPDRGRELIVSLVQGDLIELRPKGTRRGETISAFDVYHYALRCRANRAQLEKARVAKEKKAARLAAQREARWSKRIKTENRNQS